MSHLQSPNHSSETDEAQERKRGIAPNGDIVMSDELARALLENKLTFIPLSDGTSIAIVAVEVLGKRQKEIADAGRAQPNRNT